MLEARDTYLADNPPQHLHHLSADVAALWPKLGHLLYLPLLGLERPRDLYYYQGQGLEALYGFTYKYLTLEHCLGQLTRVQVGAPLAEALASTYARAWYPSDDPLTVFADWHVKPHWTKSYSHAGHVAMWGRTMPGTKQLILNGPNGRLLGGWNYPIDTHMTHILVDLEAALEHTLERPIACTIVDSEGGGLPLGERYAEAGRNYGRYPAASSPRSMPTAWQGLPAKVVGKRSKMTQTAKRFSPTGQTPSVPPKTRADLC